MGPPADSGQHVPGRRDNPERRQRHRQHRRERQHDNLVLGQLRRGRSEAPRTRGCVTRWRFLPPANRWRCWTRSLVRLLLQRPEQRQSQQLPGAGSPGRAPAADGPVPGDGQPRSLRTGVLPRRRTTAAAAILLRSTGRVPMSLVRRVRNKIVVIIVYKVVRTLFFFLGSLSLSLAMPMELMKFYSVVLKEGE